jgi:glutathione S-transferase
VRKVMIAAHELKMVDRIALVRTVVRMGQPNADLLPDNPLSKIPTLVLPDGSALFDSLTICEYLDAEAGGGRLLPPAGPARWATLTRHALCNGFLDLLILWRNERDKPPERQTQEWLDSFATKAEATLARLERDAPALQGRPFGIDQIALGCVLSYLDFRFADLDWRTGRPVLAAWHEGFAARASVRATEIVDA